VIQKNDGDGTTPVKQTIPSAESEDNMNTLSAP